MPPRLKEVTDPFYGLIPMRPEFPPRASNGSLPSPFSFLWNTRGEGRLATCTKATSSACSSTSSPTSSSQELIRRHLVLYPQEHDWIIPAGFSLGCWIFWSTIAVHREKKLISRQWWLMFACGRLLRGHIAPSPRTRAWKDPEMTVSRHRGRHWREIKVDKAGLLKVKGLLNQYYIRGRQGDSNYDEHSRVKQNTSICAMSRYEPGTIQSLGRSIALPSFGSKRFGPS